MYGNNDAHRHREYVKKPIEWARCASFSSLVGLKSNQQTQAMREFLSQPEIPGTRVGGFLRRTSLDELPHSFMRFRAKCP
jgi:lipopolysaccharide/colanic/teichoic acid biosynthesis glycosyltransferase